MAETTIEYREVDEYTEMIDSWEALLGVVYDIMKLMYALRN